MMKYLFCLILATISLITFFYSLHHSRKKHFYVDTPILMPLGIFVWGDGLVLGPFWFFSALVFMVLPELFTLRYILLFFIVRPFFEVMYWLNHQAVEKKYIPPLFKHVSWLGSQESAILYQLLNMCQMLLMMGLLALTYVS